MEFDITLSLDDIIRTLESRLVMLGAKVNVNEVINTEETDGSEKEKARQRRDYYSKKYDILLSAIQRLEHLRKLENE